MKLRVTALQADEIDHGMSVDADEGHPVWGQLVREYSSSRAATLIVTDVVNALWRITSLRDILADNDYHQTARTMQRVVDELVELAGGRDAVLALPGATAVCLPEYI